MPSNQTPNYSLNQWERDDRVLMEDFNADNAKIDAALGAHTDMLTAHTAALAKKGNCRIETRSYTGTGKNGDGVYVSIPFSAKPVAFIIIGPRCLLVADCASGQNSFAGYVHNPNYGSSFNGSATTITWSGNTANLQIFQGIQELNTANYSYRVIAFLSADQ